MAALISVGALLAWYTGRGVQRQAMALRYFSAKEFGVYWPLMNRDLLAKLDEFRDRLGYPVSISPAAGAIGRPIMLESGELGESESSAEKSWHNYLLHGEIMAIDVMPLPPGGATPAERQRWLDIARAVGFTGIGIYPHWRPRAGLHLDVRTDRTPGAPALWAGVRNAEGKQVYVGIDQGVIA